MGRNMRSRGRKKDTDGGDEATINLTPLIDVVFVVLIMFIIVAPLLEVDRIELANAPRREEKTAAQSQDNNTLKIHVRSDNSILLNSKKIDETRLVNLLRDFHQRNPRQVPQVFHDRKAYFGTYQSVKNALEGAGYDQMDVILSPP